MAKAKAKQNWNYEETVVKVEEIIDRIESGELELAKVFEEFAVATEGLKQCETFLDEKQKQLNLSIEVLEGD
ncbi:exodeoxyribonuclease VII small subunit [Oscillatoriales cyanobacterium LEGE 11467]|uniref:Exodeoxyribonuclease 7 small subunit n=1 Tax=Zarconia navalis LEGE 11467 TaxID=1828826 RepID=A0A928VZ89_9CYAN|nr:exodeoxyribonuclease VII small subunit [Zarconia navalis]MBE9041988.1 exodeoxyribonuclease VII small subunit [Zarconia navalis LEGE 11467]